MNTLSNTNFNKKVDLYFPNLNGVRFIAALMVFVCHTEGVKFNYNLPNDSANYFYTLIGKLGVILFFVLSGFLITYLLLKEEIETNKINVKKFYIRRILRIWPLYFVIVFFAFFIAPKFHFFYMPIFDSALTNNNFTSVFLVHLFLFPNLSVTLFGVVPYAGQLWSVGAEEQFYLVWPLLIKKIKNRLHLFIGVFIFYSVAKLALVFLSSHSAIAKITLGYWYYFNIDCMAIGAVCAYLVIHNKEKILKIIFSKWTQIITYSTLLILIAKSYQFKILHYETYGILFAIVILNLACNKNSIISLENKICNYLGKISYGIYMYHFIALTIAVKILFYLNYTKSIAIYMLGFIITITLSSLSYYFFESYFLHKKERYTIFKKLKSFT